MTKRILLALLLTLVAGSAWALPDQSVDIWYYDSEGNIVGWWSITCNGARSSGGTTTEIYDQISMPCQTLEPIMCSDIGMYTIGGCGDEWCYSGGYLMSYNFDMVSDCGGVCIYGEGPGSSSNYCSSCWKGTGSCPTKGPHSKRWGKRKTLTAGLALTAWELFAVIHK